MSSGVLARLADELRAEGGLLAEALTEPPPDAPAAPGAQALGAATRGGVAGYGLLVEAIYEGYLLHYARPRLLHCAEADLALLAGDRLYALGLSRLVETGDVDAVTELADVISLCAVAHSLQDPALAGAVWEAGVAAVAWGSTSEHRGAKSRARHGGPEALRVMRAATAAAAARGRSGA